MRKLVLIFTIFTALIFINVAEAKVLPQAGKAGLKPVSKTAGTTIGVFPSLRKDKKAVIIALTNLQNTTSVSYVLTYDTSDQQEAAMGSLNLTGQKTEKVELLFGTCSKNVCRYHTGIKNAKLEVSYTSKNGKKYLKRFRVKV